MVQTVGERKKHPYRLIRNIGDSFTEYSAMSAATPSESTVAEHERANSVGDRRDLMRNALQVLTNLVYLVGQDHSLELNTREYVTNLQGVVARLAKIVETETQRQAPRFG